MYSELQGAFGRQAYYRPKRFRPRDLLSPMARPALRVKGRDYQVLDFSSNGFALLLPMEESWVLGEHVEAQFVVRGREGQRLNARIARLEQGPRGVRVALGLTKGWFDLNAARELDAETYLEQALEAGPFAHNPSIPAGFRDAVAEAVHMVQFYRRALTPLEAAARAKGEAAVVELAARAYDSLAPRYQEVRERATLAAAPCMHDPRAIAAAKTYTETVLTPLLLDSPMISRAYHKPMGYPGDYQVMQYYYANAFEGSTAFAKVFHKLFVQHPLSAGVCTRKDFVVEQIDRALSLVDALAPQQDFAIMSLGCGPAQEVAGLAERRPAWNGTLHWRLIDQEFETLQVAYEGAQRALANITTRGSVECLNLSFGQLLKTPQLLERTGKQHFIYSTGLFDYLPNNTAQQLITALYACLASGGQMMIGNACGPNQYFFCPEFVLDWSLIYRTQEEMRLMAATLPQEAQVSVEREPSGAYWFLTVRKP